MKITKNIKKRLEKINCDYVSSVCSNHKNTTYRHYVSKSDILAAENGENMSYGRYNGITETIFEKQNPDKTSISYQSIF